MATQGCPRFQCFIITSHQGCVVWGYFRFISTSLVRIDTYFPHLYQSDLYCIKCLTQILTLRSFFLQFKRSLPNWYSSLPSCFNLPPSLDRSLQDFARRWSSLWQHNPPFLGESPLRRRGFRLLRIFSGVSYLPQRLNLARSSNRYLFEGSVINLLSELPPCRLRI